MIPIVAKAGWAICTRAGRRYVPRAWPQREPAQLALNDLLTPFPPTSRWRTLQVSLRPREVFDDVPEVP